MGYLTRVDHDPAGNTDLVVDPVANRWAYSFDGLNREVQAVGPFISGQTPPLPTRTFTYDAVDNLRKTTDRNTHETEYLYDVLNRTTNEVWHPTPGATPLRTMTYAYNATDDLTIPLIRLASSNAPWKALHHQACKVVLGIIQRHRLQLGLANSYPRKYSRPIPQTSLT